MLSFCPCYIQTSQLSLERWMHKMLSKPAKKSKVPSGSRDKSVRGSGTPLMFFTSDLSFLLFVVVVVFLPKQPSTEKATVPVSLTSLPLTLRTKTLASNLCNPGRVGM